MEITHHTNDARIMPNQKEKLSIFGKRKCMRHL
jgi:hypothetical protein